MYAAFEQLKSKYAGRRVCVTGGAGFIGSHLCDALAECGAIVNVIDDLSNGLRENLSKHMNSQSRGTAVPRLSEFCLVEGSILDQSKLKEAVDGNEIVFHQAALASVPRSVKEPRLYFEVNARGTLEVLEAARACNVKRVVYAASSSVYGDSEQLPKVESMQPLPLSPYASAKFAGEHFLRTYCHCYGLSGVSLRYFNIFGPRQRPDSPYAAVLPKFVDSLREGKKPVIFGDGTQTRDFTHVANAVYANLLAGVCEKPLRGESINIACGESFSLLQLLEAIGIEMRRLGFDHLPTGCEFAPPRVAEVKQSRASIDAAHSLIGYKPIVRFEDGLRHTIASMSGADSPL